MADLKAFTTPDLYARITESPKSLDAFVDNFFGIDRFAEKEVAPGQWTYPTDNGSKVFVTAVDGRLKVSDLKPSKGAVGSSS